MRDVQEKLCLLRGYVDQWAQDVKDIQPVKKLSNHRLSQSWVGCVVVDMVALVKQLHANLRLTFYVTLCYPIGPKIRPWYLTKVSDPSGIIHVATGIIIDPLWIWVADRLDPVLHTLPVYI